MNPDNSQWATETPAEREQTVAAKVRREGMNRGTPKEVIKNMKKVRSDLSKPMRHLREDENFYTA